MGLFDFFKKKSAQPVSQPQKALPEKQKATFVCDVCGKELPVKYRHKGNTCATCFESQTAHPVQPAPQPQSATPLTKPHNLDFEMVIDDVFTIKNHGVAVTGTIKKGCIYENDTVLINDCTYTVNEIDAMIDVSNIHEVDHAVAGTNVALHLSTMDATLFKRGDVVTQKALPEKQKTTFVCDVCGKELPVKYRHKGNTCAACFESQKVVEPIVSIPPTPAKAPAQPAQEKKVLPGSAPQKALPEKQKTTFVCDVCGKELPVKYRHKGNTCATCSESQTVHPVQPAPQPQRATPLTKPHIIDHMQSYSDKLTEIAFNSYLNNRGGIMGLYSLLVGTPMWKVEAFPGAGHDYDAVFRSITNYAIMHPEVDVEYIMNEVMNLVAYSLTDIGEFILFINYIDSYLGGKKNQSVPFTLDLSRILTTLKESIANYDKLRDDERFMKVFEKSKAYLLNKYGLEI